MADRSFQSRNQVYATRTVYTGTTQANTRHVSMATKMEGRERPPPLLSAASPPSSATHSFAAWPPFASLRATRPNPRCFHHPFADGASLSPAFRCRCACAISGIDNTLVRGVSWDGRAWFLFVLQARAVLNVELDSSLTAHGAIFLHLVKYHVLK